MSVISSFQDSVNNVKTWLERTTKRSYKYQNDEPIDDIKLGEITSGLVGIPADYKPESRFLRAAFVKLLSDQFDDDKTLNQIFQMLTAVNTPKGSLRIPDGQKTIYAWTQYTSGYDIKKKKLFAYTYDNRNLKELDFGNPDDWGDKVHFFNFISKQTTEPFVARDTWKEGENTI